MFFADVVYAKRSPLARVWLAAHIERRLTKQETLKTDIEQSVGAILEQDVMPMALRLSGQLLLGVVRIYSRKAKYLLDDCNDALLKIKMAFRPGVVDMTEEQLAVPRNAITLNAGDMEFDMLMGDINWNTDFVQPEPSGQNIARLADITIDAGENMDFNYDDPYANPFHFEDGIDSQELDLNLGDDAMDDEAKARDEDDSMSIEVGRDAPNRSHSLERSFGNVMGGNDDDFGLSGHLGGEDDMGGLNDFDLHIPEGGIIDWDAPIDLPDLVGGQKANDKPVENPPSPASSRLTSLPPTPPAEDNVGMPMFTPRAAARVNQIAEKKTNQSSKKKAAAKKQVVDARTELDDGSAGFGGNSFGGEEKDLSDIVGEQHFLPGSRSVMHLLQIRADPMAHFLPTKVSNADTFFVAAPPGIAPELAELFTFPSSRRRVAEENIDSRTPKRARISDVDDVEIGRREQSQARSLVMGDEVFGLAGQDDQFMFEESGRNEPMMMDMDVNMDQAEWDLGNRDLTPKARRAPSEALSRFSTPGLDNLADKVMPGGTYDDLVCPISVFDSRPQNGPQATQETQAGGEEEADVDPRAQEQKQHGFSKNTLAALAILKKELQPEEDEGGGQSEKTLSFQQVSQKATRRAASSFFFELLVLGTRDGISVKQTEPFGNIEVRAKNKLWNSGIRASSPSDPVSV